MCDASFSSALQERVKCLQELADFTGTCQAELKDLFEALGWSPESDTHAHQVEQAQKAHRSACK